MLCKLIFKASMRMKKGWNIFGRTKFSQSDGEIRHRNYCSYFTR